MKQILLLIFTFTAILVVDAQTNYEKKGDDYYKYFNYDRALKEYSKVYSKDKNNSGVLEKIINCILNDNVLRETAIPYIEKYKELKPDDNSHNYFMAVALFHGHKFDEAEKSLKAYKQGSLNKSESEKAAQLEGYISVAKKMVANPAPVKMINLGNEVNSSRADINPFVTMNGKTLFFSCDERFNTYAGIYYYNIKSTENNGNGWDKSKTLGGTVNTIYDEIVSGYGNATNEIFYNHNKNKEEVLGSVPYLGKGRVGMAFNLGMPFDMKGPEYSATLSVTGDTIVFSGADQNNTVGLYYSIKMPDNTWGEPRELPGRINSQYDDNYACYSPDGQRLYFSSNRPGSMGGYDLYYSDYDWNTNEWGEAVHLPYPINDTYDNMTISFSSDMRYAYVSAVRPEGFGNKDVYQVVFNNTPIPEAVFSCRLMIKGRPYDKPLESMPHFMVFDKMDRLVAQVSAKTPQSPFIVVLEPGIYKVVITSDETEPYEVDFEVKENSYSGDVSLVTFLLTPKQ